MKSPLALAIVLTALAFAAVPAGTASASPEALKVLIAHTDGTNEEASFRDQIAALPGVAAVDVRNVHANTPTVADLQQYDVVVVFSLMDFDAPVTMGNNLADYADGGGTVVEFALDWNSAANRHLGGRWESLNYSPYNLASGLIFAEGNLGPHEASSPLLAGVTTLGATNRQNPHVAPGAVEVAKWSDGYSAVALKGRAVGVNACVADGCAAASGDYARIVVNAGRMRAIGQLVEPDTTCPRNTFLQTAVGTANSYTVPSRGVITSWYVHDGSPIAQDVHLKVGRSAGIGAFTFPGDSPSGFRTAGEINGPFPARIPVQGGDVIGLSTAGNGHCSRASASSSDAYASPSGNPGSGGDTPVVAASGFRFPVEAIVEPDADGDGFGDLTQDKCLGVVGSVSGCRTADLSIELAASTPSTVVGNDVTYTLTVRNNGPDPAPAVTVTNALPPGARLVSPPAAIGTLASGETASRRVVITMTAPGTATDTAMVGSAANDTNPGNNSASATTSVTPVTEVATPVTAAVVSNLTQTRRKWREPGRRGRTPAGTTFRFGLDKAAAVSLAFNQRASGRSVTRGTLMRQGHAGVNKVLFLGSLTRTRKLKPGTYTLVVTATTPGAGSTSKKLRFTIVK